MKAQNSIFNTNNNLVCEIQPEVQVENKNAEKSIVQNSAIDESLVENPLYNRQIISQQDTSHSRSLPRFNQLLKKQDNAQRLLNQRVRVKRADSLLSNNLPYSGQDESFQKLNNVPTQQQSTQSSQLSSFFNEIIEKSPRGVCLIQVSSREILYVNQKFQEFIDTNITNQIFERLFLNKNQSISKNMLIIQEQRSVSSENFNKESHSSIDSRCATPIIQDIQKTTQSKPAITWGQFGRETSTQKKRSYVNTSQVLNNNSSGILGMSFAEVLAKLEVDDPFTSVDVIGSPMKNISLKSQKRNFNSSNFESSPPPISGAEVIRHLQHRGLFYQITIKLIQFLEQEQFTNTSENIIILELFETSQIRNASRSFQQKLIQSTCHALRTPLNWATNMVNLMEKHDEIAPFIKENFLNPSICSLEILRCAVNDLQDFHLLDQGNLQLRFCDFDLRELVEHCISLYSNQAKSKFLRLELEWDDQITNTHFHSDPERIKQIILNLLSNALKFTQNGSIILSVIQYNGDTVEVIVRDSGIGISEQEIKLLNQKIQTNFRDDLYFNVTESNSEQKRGIGLGLSIVSQLVKGLSNTNEILQIQSQPNVGSTFSFLVRNRDKKSRGVSFKRFSVLNHEWTNCTTIYTAESSLINPKKMNRYKKPRSDQDESVKKSPETNGHSNYTQSLISISKQKNDNPDEVNQEESEIEQTEPIIDENVIESEAVSKNQIPLLRIQLAEYQTKRCDCPEILCVDDDPFNLAVITGMLERSRFRCNTANNGQIAFDMVKQRLQTNACCPTYHLIFMDIDMPIMNGFQSSFEIKKTLKKVKQKSVICFHSAYLDKETEQKARDIGVSLVLPKPLKNKQLDDILLQIFPLYKMKDYFPEPTKK